MKTNKLLVILSILMVTSISHAQFVRGYGIKVGTVAANQSWNYFVYELGKQSTDYRWGFTAAGFVEFLNIPFVSGVAEVQYTQKGFSETLAVTKPTGPEIDHYETLYPRVDYLSIPIMVKLRVPMGVITPYIIGGPRYGFLIGKYAGLYSVVIDSFNTSDLGATIGLGAELPSLFAFDAVAEVRYNASFEDAYSTSRLKVRNHSIDIFLGVRL